MKRILCYVAILALASTGAVHASPLDPDVVTDARHGDTDALIEVFNHSLVEQPASGQVYEKQLKDILYSVGTSRFTYVLRSQSPTVRNRVVFFLNIAMKRP